MATIDATNNIPWWKEPTKDQWYAWVAAWLGWTLDAFDFTIFLLIMLPISQEFGVPLTEVAAVFTLTLWNRLVLGVQFHRRVFSGLLVPVPVPRTSGHRHGGGMAGRRGLGDGELANPLARFYGRRAA